MNDASANAGRQILAGRDKYAPECRLLADLRAFGGMAAGTIVASELRESDESAAQMTTHFRLYFVDCRHPCRA
jgi:hypothetical protein